MKSMSLQITNLHRHIEAVNEELRKVTSQLKDRSSELESERRKCDELSGDLRRNIVEKESFERQVLSILTIFS